MAGVHRRDDPAVVSRAAAAMVWLSPLQRVAATFVLRARLRVNVLIGH
ncbi:hypothetical protein [Nonomuraea sp. B1E8]